jgi:predicted nucleic acid-binding protein
MKEVFIDTNVIIDFLIDRKPFDEAAARIFALAEQKKLVLHVSSLSFSNIYYVLRRFSSDHQVLKLLEQLSILVNILPVSDEVIKKAITSGFTDFEDAIQYFCAKQDSGISAIISRDEKGFKNSDLAVFGPDAFLATF